MLRSVGALVEGPAAYGHLSGRANLRLLDASGPGDRSAAAQPPAGGSTRRWSRSGSAASGRRPVKAYSLGMRQRLGLAGGAAAPAASCSSWTSRPTALTRKASARSASCSRGCNAAGTTIFLSSHLLAEVEQLCTRVGVLDRGRLVLQEQLAALQAPTGRTVLAHARRRAGRSRCWTAAWRRATATGCSSGRPTRPR